MKALRALGVASLVGALMVASCDVNEYCLTCDVPSDGVGDGVTDGVGDGGIDAGDGGPCVITGTEVCDGNDNDCDGVTDEGPLPQVGEACANQAGECAGGTLQCAAGAIACSKPPRPEECNSKDDDCNGVVDDGDPGGGARCGTELGECRAGTLHCNKLAGVVECGLACGTANAVDCPSGGITAPFGVPETCNGKDDDCDGQFDEPAEIGPLGPCSGGPPGFENTGLCRQGVKLCDGAGGTICTGTPPPQGPTFEACDGEDNDCDGNVDEETDLTTDPTNCGACNTACDLFEAFEGCAPTGGTPPGACIVVACKDGFHDNNGMAGDGCEFGPCTIQSSVEVCNGIDDDCNPATGNNPQAPCGDCAETGLPTPPNFCLTQGACAGATASCRGTLGFRCDYAPEVSQDADGTIVAETRCDGIDNDCDGVIDEGQPNLDDECNDGGTGVCQGTGTFQCDPANLDGPAICVITNPGDPPSAEACDGKDNNCDGIVDNTTGPDRVIDAMTRVQVGALDFFIDTFEASRPDAQAASGGILETRACSTPNVQPWSNATFAAAKAACQAANKVLCTAAQWQAACEGPSNTTYPYGDAFVPSSCNTESFDGVSGGADDDVVIATGGLATCTTPTGVRDLSGNLKEWTDEITGKTTSNIDIAVLRGGSFQTPAVGASCDFRLTRAAVNVNEPTNGFRCCRATAP